LSVDHRGQNKVPKIEKIHLYIDALVVKKGIRKIGDDFTYNLLIGKARSDLLKIAKRNASICVIAADKRIENLLIHEWSELRACGEVVEQESKSGPIYRHLYISESPESSNMKEGNRVIAKT
jgi:hypothetical protein